MKKDSPEHALEFLLDFDGRVHHLERGYWLKFDIKRVRPSKDRPHGLSYSFTLHAPGGKRLVGFDNAHKVRAKGGRFKRQSAASDHWHRAANDAGRPYAFINVAALLDDFFDAVERVLHDRGIGTAVIEVEHRGDRQ